MARTLVTGGSGFVGRRLVDRLAQASPDAIVLAVGGPEVGGLDLCDEAAVAALVADFRPTSIVHLAAAASVAGAAMAPEIAWDVNFGGTRALALAARRLPEPVRFVFASSAEVYGLSFTAGPCGEDTPPQPASAYARTKLAGELLLRDLANETLRVVTLRLFNHTGPGQDTRFVAPAFAAQIARIEADGGGGVIRVGNLDAERDFSDVDDVVEAYLAVLAGPEPSAPFVLYNVGSGVLRPIRGVLDALLRLSTAEIEPSLDPERLRASDIPVAAGLFSRFQTDYGWRPRRDFEDTLRAVLGEQRNFAEGRHGGA